MRGWLLIGSVLLCSARTALGGASIASASTSTTVRCHSSPTIVCLTTTASGQTVKLRVGQRLHVVLSTSTYVWGTMREMGPMLLHESGRQVAELQHLSIWYTAVGVGRTELQTSVAPRCIVGQACPDYVLSWRAQIVVGRAA